MRRADRDPEPNRFEPTTRQSTARRSFWPADLGWPRVGSGCELGGQNGLGQAVEAPRDGSAAAANGHEGDSALVETGKFSVAGELRWKWTVHSMVDDVVMV